MKGSTSVRHRVLPVAMIAIIACTELAAFADQVSDPVVSTLHSLRNAKQTPGTVVTLEEVKREPGRHGTRVTYRIATSGFPRGKTLRLQVSSVAIPKPQVIMTGIQADESGSLTTGKAGDGPRVALSKSVLTIDDYNNGEPFKIELVGDDGGVYAADEVFPFPIEARKGSCHVWAAMLTEDRKTFAILGEGFGPDTEVRTASSEGEGKDLKEGTVKVGPNDVFAAGVSHTKRGGRGTFSAAGRSCEVTLEYAFGRQAKGPQ